MFVEDDFFIPNRAVAWLLFCAAGSAGGLSMCPIPPIPPALVLRAKPVCTQAGCSGVLSAESSQWDSRAAQAATQRDEQVVCNCFKVVPWSALAFVVEIP